MAPSADYDPTDPKYQVDPAFAPDKESSWHFPPEKDGWCLVHKALNNEIKMLGEAYKSVVESESYKTSGLKEWQVASIQKSWAGHFEHVHWHHTDEDEAFAPFARKRFHYPEKLEADHPRIEAQIDKIKKMVEGLKQGDKTMETLIAEWKKYAEMIAPHMAEEEEIALPLLRAYFTPKDMAPLLQQISQNGPKIEFGSAIYVMGVDDFRNDFMKQEGIPWFVWYVDFQYRLREFEERVVKQVDALKSGQEPTEAPASWCAIL